MQHKLKLDDQIKVNSTKTLWQKKLARLLKNKFALTAAVIIFLLYFLAIFAPFFAPYSSTKNFKNKFFHPPTKIHFTDENGLTSPYIYGTKVKEGWAEYEVNKEKKYPIKFWKQGESYQLLGVFKSNIHLFGVEADQPIAIFITTFIGLIMGGISGYYGGFIDSVIMRAVEVIMSIPSFYLLLALAAVLPLDLSSAFRFFLIVSILAFQGWAGMARVIRGMVLSVKSEDYIAAAKAVGADDKRIILKHILPSTATYVIIRATVAIPGYIIMESGLSFIGLGIQEPSASWGNMLSAAQNITKISDFPWLLLPGLFIFITVLSYNILGDGLRDALDPKY